MTDTSVDERKAALRATAQSRRDALPTEERKAAAETIAARKFPLAIAPAPSSPASCRSRARSIRCRCCRSSLKPARGSRCPAIAGRGKPLIMRAWEFGAPLDRGQWGIREPKPDAPEVEPDILLVPLLAFDRAGYRLGYGAGYYDMTIHRLRALKPVTAVGIAFAAQEVPKIPTTPRDERLDLVLTEREVIDLR